ncbi:unnamed protein product [Rotaria sp. Silwood1]|nr:unnamed protein product [Rotaria sp. Silwood1]CAF1112691.1 unnamed protein product [Rotaria sp. Silwood1]
MCTNDSTSWAFAVAPIIYGINTRTSTVTETTPHQGNEIEDEENLSSSFVESNDALIDDQDDNLINFKKGIDAEVVDLVNQSSDDAVSGSLVNTSSTLRSSSIIATTSTKHGLVRKIATNDYLTTTNKKNEITSR